MIQAEDKRQHYIVISILMVLLLSGLLAFSKIKSLTGFAVLDNADLLAEKETYAVGDMASLFIFPSDADYEIEVYGPDGRLYANALNFPVEKTGTYNVKAILRHNGEEKELSAMFNVMDEATEEPASSEAEEAEKTGQEPMDEKIEEENEESGNDISLLNATPAADESTPINTSAEAAIGAAEHTSNAAGVALSPAAPEVAEDVGDTVKDGEGDVVGKKVEDEETYETFFVFVGKEGDNFRLSLYHNNTRPLPVWIEGDVSAESSSQTAQPNEIINISVPLSEGNIPRFKLHVGPDSDVFEFGITIINVKSYPTIGGNWTVEFNTTGLGNLVITPVEGTEFDADLQFLELRCGDAKLSPVYDGSKVIYADYSCGSLGYETSNVISGGTHKLLFQFGDAQAMAENYAAKYVCLDGCDYSDLTGCLNTLNTTDAGCVLNESNQVYEINADLSFYFPLSDVAESVIKINATNVTVNCNRSNIIGNNIGYGVLINTQTNSTIINCNISNFDYGIYLGQANDTIINNTYINASDLYGIYVNYSYRTNITDSRVTYSLNNDGIRIAASHISFIKEVNLSNNFYSNLFSDELSDILWIYDSYFYNSSMYYNVVIKSNKTVFENNIVRNTTSDNNIGGIGVICLAAASPPQICTNLTIRNNTVENNALNLLLTNSDNALIENNYFGEHTDTSFTALAFNTNVAIADCLNCNATLRGNIFNSSKGNQLTFADMAGTYTKVKFVNVTNNSFYRTPTNKFDIWFENSGHSNNSFWLNNFYSGRGVNDSFGYNNSYCVSGKGNFYIDTTNKSYIQTGDCGPANITFPNLTSIFISEPSIRINWTNQSSISTNVTYHVFYSMNSGSQWIFAASTNDTNYTLDISAIPNTNKFAVKVTPFDGTYNATFANISGFRLGPDNQRVCSNESVCEYQNITGAAENENNTANNITLVDPNMAYNFSFTRSYNLSVDDGNEAAIMINGTNITLNCLDSEINGKLAGYGIFSAGFNNITVRNCKVNRFNIGINFSNSRYDVFSNVRVRQSLLYGVYAFNLTNSSFTDLNSSDNTDTNLYLMNSSNNTITSSRFINSTGKRGMLLNASAYNIISSVNSSRNVLELLFLANNSDFNLVQNSNFENSTGSHGIVIYSSNNSIFMNTLLNIRTAGMAAIFSMGKSSAGVGAYNNISNNTIQRAEIPIMISSSGNWIMNNIINSTNNVTYGAISLAGSLTENNTVRRNVINNTQGTGIYIGFYADGYADRNNLTGNVIQRSNLASGGYYALYINTSSGDNNIWNNSFYDSGVIDNGTSNLFCVGNEGNFYAESLTHNKRQPNDCGPANITAPDGGASYKGIIQINWTKQSSPRNVSYYLFFSNNSGTNWTYLASTPYTNYSWDTTWLENYSMYAFMVKIIPYDGYFNATNDNSTSTFNITINNNWVCTNSSYCEYTDMNSALSGQNNTAQVISLMDSNKVYALTSALAYNISPSESGVAINMSKSNIILDCNNSVLLGSGKGYGVYASGQNNITILNCELYNYSFGSTIIAGLSSRIANMTINGSRKTGLNLSHVNDSTVEYSRIFASITGNLILEKSKNNTIQHVNLTGSSQYGLYIISSNLNRIYYLNSSANTYENVYIDVKSANNTIENSTFANSTRNNMYIAGSNNNITTSDFMNITAGYWDILINGSASYTSVWLNNLYSKGINNSGTNSLFCVNNSGNYYNPNITSTYRVVGSCGNLSQAYADKDNDGYYTIYDCNDNNVLFYPGAAEYCDNADNDCDGSIDEGGVCVAESFKSSGTGGTGGGGGFSFTTYKTINLQEQPVFSIAKYEEVKFNVKGIDHTLKLQKIYDDYVNVTLSSKEMNFDLYVNETRKIDFDEDNVLDLGIKLTAIQGSRANFYLQELQPVVEQLPEEKKEEPAGEKPQVTEVVEEKPQEEKTANVIAEKIRNVNKRPFIMMGMVLLAIGILTSGFVYYRSVVERIKPMEDFIESALEKGYPVGRIRNELIEAGWDETVIDSVLGTHKEMHTVNELRGYVHKAFDNGFTKQQVKDALIGKGWKDEDIEKLFK